MPPISFLSAEKKEYKRGGEKLENYGKRSAVFRTGIAESGKKHYHIKKEGLPFGKRGRSLTESKATL